MFGVHFVIKIILLWMVANLVLVESVRQKKDVHHMIFLREPIKSHRHKHHHNGNSGRSKRNKHKHHQSSEESFESSEEDYSTTTTERPKVKREQHKHRNHHHKSHKKHHKKHQNSDFNTVNEAKWVPMRSQELFGKTSTPPVYPGGYRNGAIHFSQPVPIEITTQYPLYPPLDSDYKSKIVRPTLADSPLIGTVDTYKPFDYSILEKKPKIVTPLSIIVEEDKGANNNQIQAQTNQIRGRGTSRFRVKQKNQQ
ncbi:unnamed protein product [Ceutorhynchus assimilis]|uniref:Uncharacterized protein n=1 Tax=Ceutorhynchus assimilis TaxID=467358 RepID=A0A9N9MJU0_9CUCU|nr:unnamed protein product [Ceutorhynchus assimilis]